VTKMMLGIGGRVIIGARVVRSESGEENLHEMVKSFCKKRTIIWFFQLRHKHGSVTNTYVYTQ